MEDGRLVVEDIPLNLCPGECDLTQSCTTMMVFLNEPVPVIGASAAFVGISTTLRAECDVCAAVQMVQLPAELQREPLDDPCVKNPCLNGGECVSLVTDVVDKQRHYDYRSVRPSVHACLVLTPRHHMPPCSCDVT